MTQQFLGKDSNPMKKFVATEYDMLDKPTGSTLPLLAKTLHQAVEETWRRAKLPNPLATIDLKARRVSGAGFYQLVTETQ